MVYCSKPALEEHIASHKSSCYLLWSFGWLLVLVSCYCRSLFMHSQSPIIAWKVSQCLLIFLILYYLFQCNLVHIFNEETWSGRLRSFSSTIWSALLYIFEHSYVSSVGSLTLLMASYSFVPSKLSRRKRAIIGGLHVLAHLTAALLLMLLLELGIEICIRNHLLATSGMPCHIVLHIFLS